MPTVKETFDNMASRFRADKAAGVNVNLWTGLAMLVVDDDTDFLESLKVIFEAYGADALRFTMAACCTRLTARSATSLMSRRRAASRSASKGSPRRAAS